VENRPRGSILLQSRSRQHVNPIRAVTITRIDTSPRRHAARVLDT
jgi:hypothetical protein